MSDNQTQKLVTPGYVGIAILDSVKQKLQIFRALQIDQDYWRDRRIISACVQLVLDNPELTQLLTEEMLKVCTIELEAQSKATSPVCIEPAIAQG